jgi:hypothetical protein
MYQVFERFNQNFFYNVGDELKNEVDVVGCKGACVNLE